MPAIEGVSFELQVDGRPVEAMAMAREASAAAIAHLESENSILREDLDLAHAELSRLRTAVWEQQPREHRLQACVGEPQDALARMQRSNDALRAARMEHDRARPLTFPPHAVYPVAGHHRLLAAHNPTLAEVIARTESARLKTDAFGGQHLQLRFKPESSHTVRGFIEQAIIAPYDCSP